jgi:hypothetical protein
MSHIDNSSQAVALMHLHPQEEQAADQSGTPLIGVQRDERCTLFLSWMLLAEAHSRPHPGA